MNRYRLSRFGQFCIYLVSVLRNAASPVLCFLICKMGEHGWKGYLPKDL